MKTGTERLYRVAANDGAEIGEYSLEELQAYWDAGQLDRGAMYLHPAGQWRPLRTVVRDVTQQRVAAGGAMMERTTGDSDRRRWVYVLLALFLGGFGIHNFYAQRTGVAVAQLALTLSSAVLIVPVFFVWVWCLVECFAVTRDGRGDLLG